MALFVDQAEVDAIAVEGMLPLALQHGGAGLRLGHDSGFPVSRPSTRPPAPLHRHGALRAIDAPGSLRPDPADEVRTALHAD